MVNQVSHLAVSPNPHIRSGATTQKIMLTVVVEDDKVNSTVELICNTARTGEVGDGKIFVSPIDEVIRIRTDERGESAV